MKIKIGQKLLLSHSRKGIFLGEATKNFDTDNETFYPMKLVEGTPKSLGSPYNVGDSVPCRANFTVILEVDGKPIDES